MIFRNLYSSLRKRFLWKQHSLTISFLGLTTRLRSLPQYREKSAVHDNLGLLTYPVLMSSDILLYKATHVPVGQDQDIHIEFCNQVAQYFNTKYRTKVLNPVSKLITAIPRVKSLSDPAVKMSKSYGKAIGCVGLLDTDDLIQKKVRKAVTDSLGPITVDFENRPGIYNLLVITSAIREEPFETVSEEYIGKGAVVLKSDLTDLLVEKISKIRNSANQMLDDESFLIGVLDKGGNKARLIASQNLKELYKILGLI